MGIINTGHPPVPVRVPRPRLPEVADAIKELHPGEWCWLPHSSIRSARMFVNRNKIARAKITVSESVDGRIFAVCLSCPGRPEKSPDYNIVPLPDEKPPPGNAPGVG